MYYLFPIISLNIDHSYDDTSSSLMVWESDAHTEHHILSDYLNKFNSLKQNKDYGSSGGFD